VEEGTPLAAEVAAGRTPAPDEEEAVRSLNATADACRRAGYRHYEISNYARPGRESRHNLRYWRLQPYLGVGPSAASTLPGRNGPLRLTGGTTERGYSAERVEPEAFLLEHVMMGLRTAEGVSRQRFAEIFGIDLVGIMPRSIGRFTRKGLLQTEAGRLQPTERGMMLLDHLLAVSAAEIDEHLPAPEQLRLQWPLPDEQ
jgi:oxygen-independent coproporphyrinogen-3 oxidase